MRPVLNLIAEVLSLASLYPHIAAGEVLPLQLEKHQVARSAVENRCVYVGNDLPSPSELDWIANASEPWALK